MGIKAIFGANLKYYRKRIDLSQEQLSEKLEITPKHLSAIETGAAFVSSELLEKLVLCLGVPASDLFYVPGQSPDDEILLTLCEEIVKKSLQKTADNITAELRHGALGAKSPANCDEAKVCDVG
jgi:transcriptional regulator with XRE-family HTH domain